MTKQNENKSAVSRRAFVKATAAGIGATAISAIGAQETHAAQTSRQWDMTADVVVIGAGATGLPASIEAIQNGASVILVEQNFDIGGHAIQSGARLALGGGTSMQKKHGVQDSADALFADLVNWHDYRMSDRDIVRAFCDQNAPTYEWLVANGVVFDDQSLGGVDGGPQNVKRSQRPVWNEGPGTKSPTGSPGTALMRPLEASARKLGVQILLEHSLTELVRENNSSGRVLGIIATNKGKIVNIRANKGVILGTVEITDSAFARAGTPATSIFAGCSMPG
jgi:succinate dehydrogenase/fumarate reductase flavoprotein subunit